MPILASSPIVSGSRITSILRRRSYGSQSRRGLAMEQHEAAASYVGMSRKCPFDLHSLVPVPSSILRLSEDDPRAKAWMWEHWSTTWPLRYVQCRLLSQKKAAVLPEGHVAFRVAF